MGEPEDFIVVVFVDGPRVPTHQTHVGLEDGCQFARIIDLDREEAAGAGQAVPAALAILAAPPPGVARKTARTCAVVVCGCQVC